MRGKYDSPPERERDMVITIIIIIIITAGFMSGIPPSSRTALTPDTAGLHNIIMKTAKRRPYCG